MDTLLIIGCGNMGNAVVLGQKKGTINRLLLYDIETAKALKLAAISGGEAVLSIDSALREASTVLLSVKPQSFPKLMGDIANLFTDNQLIVSIMAGIKSALIKERIRASVSVVRAMPNTPALVGEGLTALSGDQPEAISVAEKLFSAIGKVIVVPEKMMDAVTAISGSGPAYLFYFVESLLRAALENGFDAETARTIVYQTIQGSAKLLVNSTDGPEELRRKVTSPGGVTETIISELERAQFTEIIGRAVSKGIGKSVALGNRDRRGGSLW